MTPKQVLAQHGSSFYWASQLLRRQDALDIAHLYAVCRLIDDWADEVDDRAEDLSDLLDALCNHAPEHVPVAGFTEMVQRRALDLTPLAHLAQMALKEAKTPTVIATESELLEYCYAVAGTVGELMCPLLGAHSPEARVPAIALGIAMQMTNIARDVLEDAQMGRCYVPAEWINHLPPTVVAQANSSHRTLLQGAIARLIQMSETHYELGRAGLPLLPWRNRQAIGVAAELYRHIGLKLHAKECRYWEGRVYLTPQQRLITTSKTFLGWRHGTL
jgi:phytoene synthase